MTKSNLGKKEFISFTCPHHSPSLKEVRARVQSRNLEAEIEAETMEEYYFTGLLPMAYSKLLSYTTQDHLSGAPPTPHQLWIKKMLPRLIYKPILWIYFVNWDSLFPDDLNFFQVDKEITKHHQPLFLYFEAILNNEDSSTLIQQMT